MILFGVISSVVAHMFVAWHWLGVYNKAKLLERNVCEVVRVLIELVQSTKACSNTLS